MYAKGGVPSGTSRSIVRAANNNTGSVVVKDVNTIDVQIQVIGVN